MSKDLNQDNAYIFRILHKDSIGQVLEGGCHCGAESKDQRFVEIGNHELIEKRARRAVPCEPGGTLVDYIPFYFTPYTPMLYNIKTGYNGVVKRPVADILILVSSLHRLEEMGIPFVFTDRHAYLKAARFSADLSDLDWIIWPVLQQRNFKKDDVDKFEKYQAEALVYKHLPIEALSAILCYDRNTRDSVRDLADQSEAEVNIVTGRKWFL